MSSRPLPINLNEFDGGLKDSVFTSITLGMSFTNSLTFRSVTRLARSLLFDNLFWPLSTTRQLHPDMARFNTWSLQSSTFFASGKYGRATRGVIFAELGRDPGLDLGGVGVPISLRWPASDLAGVGRREKGVRVSCDDDDYDDVF